MKKTRITLLLIFVMSLSLVPIGLISFTAAQPKNGLPNYEPLDFNLFNKNPTTHFETIDNVVTSSSSSLKSSSVVGDIVPWIWYDDLSGLYLSNYILAYDGEHCQIWVRCYVNGTFRLNFPSSDPRNPVVVTTSQIEYLGQEFDTNIYPNDRLYFGEEDFHDGSNAGLSYDYYDAQGRTAILVSNIGDENYYNSSYPYYIAGFYWGSVFEPYTDRNVISIDSFDWQDRIGPDVARPFVYEATIAHEFQHLIHDDWNPGDDTFMNEGCSMYAELVCGYGIDPSYLNSYFYTPDNSLTMWGDQGDINILADYGVAALWTIYLSDHYGGSSFIKHFVEAGIPGIDGINAALQYYGYKHSNFNTVFHDWRLANIIRAQPHYRYYRTNYGCGCSKGYYKITADKYGYSSIDLNAPGIDPINVNNVAGKNIPWTKGTDLGNTYTILGYDTGNSMIGPFATDYITFDDVNGLSFEYFAGDATSVVPGWTYIPGSQYISINPSDLKTAVVAGGYWYSGAANLLNTLIVAEVSVPTSDPILTIVTNYDTEDFWDYGFVQISTDGGSWDSTWTSLANSYTTSDYDPAAISTAVENLPGLTGSSNGQVMMTFDLSAYAGQTVHIGFRYVTDWATFYDGWYLYSADVNGVSFFDNLDSVYPTAHFMVTLLRQTPLHNGKFAYAVNDMRISNKNNMGMEYASTYGKQNLILVVSPIMMNGFTDYSFKAQSYHYRFHCYC
jgi:immune inhibitor A